MDIHLHARLLRRMKRLCEAVHFRPHSVVTLMALSICEASLQAVSMALLVPLVQSFLSANARYDLVFPRVWGFLNPPISLDNAPDGKVFGILLGVIFVTNLLAQLAKYAGTVKQAKYILRFQSDLRKLLFQRYMKFGKAFFDRNSMGSISVTLTTFINDASILLGHFFSAFHTGMMALCYLLLCIYLSWRLTLYSIFIIPILLISARLISKKIRIASLEQARMETALNKRIVDVLFTIPLIKAYSQEAQERARFGETSDELFHIRHSLARKVGLLSPLQEVVLTFGLMILIAISFHLTRAGIQQMSGFAVFFLVIRRLAGAVSTLNGVTGHVAALEGQLNKLLEMFTDAGKAYVVGGTRVFRRLTKAIEFRNVSFSYESGQPILKKLTMTFKAGEVTAIVGPTGVGKSTIVNLLMRYYDCQPGQIFIDGVDIKEFTLESLSKQFAYVGQEAILLNDTIERNLIYGLDKGISQERMDSVLEQACLSDFVRALPAGLQTVVGDRGIRLSGGEKQRIALARAILKDTGILVLDEATSSLDSSTELLVQKAIYNATRGKAAIVIAHRLSTIRHADAIYAIQEGRVVESGQFDALIEKSGLFQQFWQAQAI